MWQHPQKLLDLLGASSIPESRARFQLDRAQNQSVADSGAFGGGPRLCPGRFLASQAAQQVLAAILGKDGFQWTLQEGQDLEQQYIPGLFSADGLLLKLL